MSGKVKLIFVDGPDGAGKTTFIKHMQEKYNLVLFTMPKVDRSGSILKVNEYKDFELMKALLVNLDPNYVYIFDRCYLSNITYDPTDSFESIVFRDWLKDSGQVNTLELIFSRDGIDFDFSDDKIDISKERFNEIIQTYEDYASQNGDNFYKLVEYDLEGNFLKTNQSEIFKAEQRLYQFIYDE